MAKVYKIITYNSENEALRNLKSLQKEYNKYDIKKIKNFIYIFKKDDKNN